MKKDPFAQHYVVAISGGLAAFTLGLDMDRISRVVDLGVLSLGEALSRSVDVLKATSFASVQVITLDEAKAKAPLVTLELLDSSTY